MTTLFRKSATLVNKMSCLLLILSIADVILSPEAFSLNTSNGSKLHNPRKRYSVRTPAVQLKASVASNNDKPSSSTPSPTKSAGLQDASQTESATSSKNTDKKIDGETLEMPWSDVQDWALRDNLGKFTVTLPSSSSNTGKPQRYAMWRTLTREVPELAGYPIPFLIKAHRLSSAKENKDGDPENKSNRSVEETPGVLPMVDDFEFAPNGGISGRAYGFPGIADGTRIQTPPLVGVEKTVPLGYVTTQDANSDGGEDGIGFSYELGTCASSSVYSLDGTERSAALLAARRMMMEGSLLSGASASSKQLTNDMVNVAKDMAVTGSGLLSDTESNRDLVYLGGATAMLLASATAVGMLSHHLTVNVFWV